MVWVMSPGEVAIQHDGLVADHTVGSVCRRRTEPVGIEVRLCPGHEEGISLVQPMQAGEIQGAPIDDIDGTRLGKQHIERMHIVQFAVGYVNEARSLLSDSLSRDCLEAADT